MTSDDESDEQHRERPRQRRHETYDQDHWETAHIERVDQIGAFESPPFGEDPVRSREVIRVDLDGFGHGGASMHDVGDNVQCSFWLTPERARELHADLGGLLDNCDLSNE